MDKNNNEAVFDEILASAFTESVEEEIAQCEKEYSGECALSEKHVSEERRAYEKAVRRAGRKALPRWVNLCCKAAAVVVTVGIISGVVALCIPDVQADYASMTATYYEDYIFFESNHTVYSGPQVEYVCSYVPEGFKLTTDYKFPDCNGDDIGHFHYIIDDIVPYIDVDYGRNGCCKFFCDVKNTKVTTVNINGNVGYLVDELDTAPYSLLWNDGINTFHIAAIISTDELMKFARGIVRIDGD